MSSELFKKFEQGRASGNFEDRELAEAPWVEHKNFKGVRLKHLLTSVQTNGQFSCHLVSIEAGHNIGLHQHPESAELHEIISGSGVCLTCGRELPYSSGVVVWLPAGEDHEVRAGEEGLCLFAKFIPALC